LDLSEVNSPGLLEQAKITEKTKTEEFIPVSFRKHMKNNENNRKKESPSIKKFFMMKTKATNMLLKDVSKEKMIDNQNKAYFNRNSYFYLDYFGEIREKMNLSQPETKSQENTNKIDSNMPVFYKKMNAKTLASEKNDRILLKNNSNINERIKSEMHLPVIKVFHREKLKELAQENLENLKNNRGFLQMKQNKTEKNNKKKKIVLV